MSEVTHLLDAAAAGDRQAAADLLPLVYDELRKLAAAAEAMRRILIESARRKHGPERGGGFTRHDLDPDQPALPCPSPRLLALDEALDRLAAIEPRAAEVVKLRYFAGLTVAEAASVLGISPRTADNDWAYARAWLVTALHDED
jgi:RNA polymerase sigma factor (TIGR02999 family)